ncbi:MAG TPA: hypothetical protein VG944_16735, partial [Fimbriimonas sp.]|nr:hypothetical protein [Fimbriimonas sp.]
WSRNLADAWSYTVSAPIVGSDGTIYVESFNSGEYANRFNAVNPDGTVKWTHSTVQDIQTSSPAIGADGTVFMVLSEGGSGPSLVAFAPVISSHHSF